MPRKPINFKSKKNTNNSNNSNSLKSKNRIKKISPIVNSLEEINHSLSNNSEIREMKENKENKKDIKSRKKTPYIHKKQNSHNLNNLHNKSSDSINEKEEAKEFDKEISALIEDIRDFNEKTTINFLNNLVDSLEKENKKLKEENKNLQKENKNLTEKGNDVDLSMHENIMQNAGILKKYLKLEIDPLTEQDGHIFTFNFKQKNIEKYWSFVLRQDEDYENSYHYKNLRNRNVDLPEAFGKGNGFCFQKTAVIPFFKEIFTRLSKII